MFPFTTTNKVFFVFSSVFIHPASANTKSIRNKGQTENVMTFYHHSVRHIIITSSDVMTSRRGRQAGRQERNHKGPVVSGNKMNIVHQLLWVPVNNLSRRSLLTSCKPPHLSPSLSERYLPQIEHVLCKTRSVFIILALFFSFFWDKPRAKIVSYCCGFS